MGREDGVCLQIQKQFHIYCHTAWQSASPSTYICLFLTAFPHTICQWLGIFVLLYFSKTLEMGRRMSLLPFSNSSHYLLKTRPIQGYAPTFPGSSLYSIRSDSRFDRWKPPVLRLSITSYQPRPCFSQRYRNSLPISKIHQQGLIWGSLGLACIRPHSRSLVDLYP